MSFTMTVIDELTAHEYDKTCCKKAFLFGLFFSAERIQGRTVRAEFKTERSALYAVEILKKQFSSEPVYTSGIRAGRTMHWVSVDSKAISAYIDKLGRGADEGNSLAGIIGLRCDDCRRALLAGLFVSSGIATDPEKRYSIEFIAKSEAHASLLSELLCDTLGAPRCIDRRGRIGFYYKGNEATGDALSYIGAYRASFAVIEAYMTHAIKNDENRATNCVLKNLEKSVSAARRHIDAIEALRASGRFELLSDDLKYTANLRCEYDSATLAELAALHDPSISKSGLNKRLENILIFAAKD